MVNRTATNRDLHGVVALWAELVGFHPLFMRYKAIATLMGAGLGDRLLFGSDFPVTLPSSWLRELPRRELPWIARLFSEIPALSSEQWQLLREGNARRLSKLDAAP